MPGPLRYRFFWVVVFLSLGAVQYSYSQSCNGADGVSPVGGGLIQTIAGDICANTAAIPGQMRIEATNVDDGGDPSHIGFRIDWHGDATFIQDVFFSAGEITNTGPNSYQAIVSHFFPPAGGNVRCEYFPTVRLLIDAVPCPSTLGVPPRFVRWNVDDENTGQLELSETVTGAVEYLVCAGTETIVTFTDRSTLNCVPPELLTNINQSTRWRRYTYGISNSITGPVLINGVAEVFPFVGPVEMSAITGVVAPFPNVETFSITVPATAQVGEIFELQMDYWNFCNRFDLGQAPVLTTARIRVVDQPLPPSSTPITYCNGDALLPFQITVPVGVPASSIVNWYENDPGNVPGALITQGTSRTLSTNLYPTGPINNTSPGVYTVWASYYAVNNADGVSCESPKIPVTITIREPLPTPPMPAGATQFCDGSSFTLTLPPPATEVIGGATEYAWVDTPEVMLSSTTSNTATFDIDVTTFGGSPFVDRTVRVRRRFTTTPTCQSLVRDYVIRVYAPTLGGTLSPVPDVCEGTDVGTITLSGHRGQVQRWEVSFNGGAFVPDGSLGTNTSISPGVLGFGNWRYRAVVANGTCAEVNSTEEEIEVFANPGTPVSVGPDQSFCKIALDSDPLGGSNPAPGTGQWSLVSGPGTAMFTPDANTPNASVTVSTQGAYILRWTVTNGLCVLSDDIQVDFGTDPGPQDAGTPETFCGLTGSLNAVAPVIGNLLWAQIAGPGTAVFGDDTSPTSSITVDQFGTYTFEMTVTSGNCVPRTDQVDITFNQSSTATAIPDFTSCLVDVGPFPAIPLTGTVDFTTLGRWEVVSGTGVIQSSGAALGSDLAAPTINDAYVPSALDYSNGGAITVRLVAIDPDGPGPCISQTDDVVITIERRPRNVSAGADQPFVCIDETQLDALVPEFGTGTWSSSTPGVIIVDPADPQTLVQNLPMGTTVLTWTVVSLGTECADVVDDVAITRVAPPTVANLNPATICEESAGAPIEANGIDLTSYNDLITTLPAANRTITWFRNAPPPVGINLTSAPPPQDNIMTGTFFVARVRDNTTSCESDGTINFSVQELPEAVDATVQVCEDGPAGSNTATGVNLNDATYVNAVIGSNTNVTIRWYPTQADATFDMNQIMAPVDVNVSRTVFARITDNDPPNCFDIAQLDLVVKPLPTNDEIFGKSTVCVGDGSVPPDELPVEIYQVTPVSGAKYFWDIPDDPATEFKVFGGGTENDFFVLLQFPNVFSGTIRVTVELNECGGTEITKDITVSPTPSPFSIVGTNIVCENDTGIPFSVSPNNFPGSSYNWEITRASDGTPGGALVANGQTTGSVLVNFLTEDVRISVSESNSANCAGPPQNLIVAVNPRPIMLDPSKEVCSDDVSAIVFQDDALSPVPSTKWDISATAVTPGVLPITGPTSGIVLDPAAISNDAFENPRSVPLPVRYTVTPIHVDGVTSKECPGTTRIVTLTVKPEPQLDPNLDRAICSDEETQITLVSAPNTFPADKFIVESVDDGGLTLLNPPLPAFGFQLDSDAIFGNRWENTTSDNVVVTYVIRPYSTVLGCEGDPPVDLSVTVFPKPLVAPVALPPICSGDKLNIVLATSNGVVGTTYVWSVKSITGNIVGATSGTGGIIGDVLINNDLVQGSVVYEVQARNPATKGGCLGPPIDVTVLVNPSPPAAPLTKVVCSDTPGGNSYLEDLVAIQPEVSTAPGATFTWFSNQADPPGSVITGADLNAYTLLHNTPIYVRVDNGTCSKVVSVTYTVNPGISLSLSATDYNGFELKCNNDNTGQVTAIAALGTPLYSYSINGGPFITANQFTFLNAGTHTVIAQDSKGCTATEMIDLEEPPVLAATLTEAQPIRCFLEKNGVLQTNASGGTGTYTFLLLQNPTNTTGVSTGIFTDISIGTYNVRVTDVNGCTVDTAPITIDQPTQVELSASVVEDANGFQLSCKDATDGVIDVEATGGNGADYTYTLRRLGDIVDPYAVLVGNVSESFTNLPFGNYSITVTDVEGCPSLPAIAVIVNPPPFEAGFVGINQAICAGDDPAVIDELVPPFGGIGNYQYQWQQSSTGSLNDADWTDVPAETSPTFDPPVIPQTTFYRRLVTSGSCEVKGKDNIVRVTVNPLPVATFNGPAEVCQGESFLLLLDLTTGTSPIDYDYTANTIEFFNLIGTENTFVPVTNFQQNTTYTLTRLKDFNGCVAPVLPPPVVVNVIKVNPDFNVIEPSAQCQGGDFTFEWNVEADVTYTWLWGDNSFDVINPGDRPIGPNIITHVFATGSTQTSTIYPVRLQAENTLCSPKIASKPVTVFPNIALNIQPGIPLLCSGEAIQFTNQSLGVDIHRWYYRIEGTTDVIDERTSASVTYVLENNTGTNPIRYEVIYEARNNEGCTAQYSQVVEVFRAVNAAFTVTPNPPPPFTGGVSQVSITNQTNPIDEDDFSYTWDFGDNQAVPPNGTGVGPFDVEYNAPGFKDITLTVVNIDAGIAGKTCESIAFERINIELPVIGAAFRATPLAACFPVDIVVENLSPGADTFEWELYNESGLVATSNLNNPVFRILNPGTYSIYLVASFSPTGQSAQAQLEGIEIFDTPNAIFDVRPTTVFVPDTELRTFNDSRRANSYEWDFDDGSPISTEFQPNHFYREEGQYVITLIAGFNHGAKDVDGDGVTDGDLVCADTAQVEVLAREGGLTKIPNAFTPNEDGPNGGVPGAGGFNDVFLPITRGVEEFTMQIFDRWGTLIYESRDKNVGWDGYDRNGNLLPAGVYVYKLVMRLSDGQRTTQIGDITLIR